MSYAQLSQADKLRYAKLAFKEFWQVAKSEFPSNMQMSFEEFYGYMSQRTQAELADFGQSVYDTGTGWGADINDAWDAMRSYARKTQGRVAQYDDGFPRLADFYDALLGKMNEWNVSRIGAAFGNTAKESLEAATGAASVALGSYLGISAVVSIVGIFFVIMSFKKK